LRRDRSPDEYRQTLSAARDQADRLRRIVESLLTLARSEHGATTKPAETLDLAAWLTKHVETWAYRDGESNIRLAVDDRVETAVDTELLGPMLDVLIENAVKYSPPKAPVQIRLSNDRGRATIDVIDSGPGVPESESGDIFRPFHRGDDAIRRGVPGLGLGLALAARIAERIGATLSFDRPADGGSRFRIAL
jgi:signal transduction histidine kinase